MKKAWYLQSWFLCLLFALWPFLIPAILGIILLIKLIRLDAANNKILIQAGEILEYQDKLVRLPQEFSDRFACLKAELDKKSEAAQLEFKEQEAKLKQAIKDLTKQKTELQGNVAELQKEYLVDAVSIEAYAGLKSDEVKNELALLSLKQKEMIKNDQALNVKSGKTKKELDATKKQILLCFNSETTSIIESVNIKNADNCRAKLQRAFENINKIFSVDEIQISQDFFKTKLDELSLVYGYIVKMEEEKELQRAIREQLQEEEKVRREIEREKQKLEKEESQFQNEIGKLMAYMQKATQEVEKALYVDKIRELEEKLKLLEKDKENVLQREQNTRAGFVYVISNIGSFGENVYKIGMTRRLEPMDRIKELGDASVPFSFDVHAMIFSEDAPSLETTLHQTFRENQVNKLNPRKEFFNIDLANIEKVVTESYNATVKFIDIPEAYEYRESRRLSEPLPA